jgi:hypothetical protein
MEISTQFKSAGTKFASPDRSSASEIEEQAASISKMDILCELLNAMPELVMILNPNRQIIFGNRVVADFAVSQGGKCYFGLRPGELVMCQHALDAESGCGTGDACKTCGAVLSILQALSGVAAKDECRILRVTGKGIEPLDMRSWARPFIWNGQTYCLLILSDISNEKRRQVLERIFFHDVLNTAGNIWSIAELLNRDAVDINDLKKDLSTASAQLIDEINSQRQLLAAESNELQVNLTTISSIEILNSVAETYRNHEIATGKMIEVEPSSPDFELETDETLLFRVLGNLLKNSLEASKSKQTVVMGCGQNDKEYFFWTRNSTVMPEEVKLQVFQRSYSTKGPGRGIGTYSIKLLTEKYLKGKVSFVSGPESTTFTITFPKPSK